MEWIFYILAFLVATALSGSAVYALYWSSKHGQLRDFERGARSIFDAREPVGQMTDHFPAPRRRAPGPGHATVPENRHPEP